MTCRECSVHPAKKLPTVEAIMHLFSATLSRDVRVRAGDFKTTDWQSVVATYKRRDDGQLGGAWVSSIELAASLGAGLSMIPIGIVRDCIKGHDLEPPVLEGFNEVANIASQLLSGAGQPLALSEIRVLKRADRGKLDKALVVGRDAQFDFEAEVTGYVKGNARLIIL